MPDPEQKNEPSTLKQLARMDKYWQIAVLLPAATFIGWAVGAGLDHWLHTTWLYVVGLLLGIVAGFVQVIRLALTAKD